MNLQYVKYRINYNTEIDVKYYSKEDVQEMLQSQSITYQWCNRKSKQNMAAKQHNNKPSM